MSKKTLYISIILIIAIVGVSAWYFLGRTDSANVPGSSDNGTNYFPFGQGGAATTSNQPGGLGTGSGDNTNIDQTIDLSVGSEAPKLYQLWKDQVAGATFVSTGSTTIGIRFVDRATGHIYESSIDTIGETKISNITIPQVYETLWATDAKQMVIRYLKDDSSIQSFYAKLSDDAPTIEGFFLPSNIREMAVLGEKILYFDPSETDGSLTQSGIDGTKKSLLASLNTNDWLISWTNSKNALLTTRPSGTVGGFGFLVDTTSGATTKIANNIRGLTGTLSPSGEVAFLSASQGSGMVSAAYSVKDKTNAIVSLSTLSDKCSWSNTEKNVIYCAVPTTIPSGTYPDDWYKGLISFNDRIWKIDMVSGETDLISELDFEAANEMDITKLSLDVSDSHILFTNKKDMSLWVYKIK